MLEHLPTPNKEGAARIVAPK